MAQPQVQAVDPWISADIVNAQVVHRALREFGALLADLTEAAFSQSELRSPSFEQASAARHRSAAPARERPG